MRWLIELRLDLFLFSVRLTRNVWKLELFYWFCSSCDTARPWKSTKTRYQIREFPHHYEEFPKSSNNFQVSYSNQNTFPQVQMSSTDDWFMLIQVFVLHRIASSSAAHEGPTLITFFLFPNELVGIGDPNRFECNELALLLPQSSIGTRMNYMD